MHSRPRITVLISGSGTNLQALIDAAASGRLPVELAHVISNVESAAGLKRAAAAGIPTSILPHGDFENREDFDRALALLIAANQPDLVVLAGFMRIIGPAVLDRFQGRMINLHPSLLPLYRGTQTYQRALDAGDREHGASIHFVTLELDGGPVISQVRIPVLEGDDAESLARRLAPEEHRLVVATVEFLASNRVECQENGVLINDHKLESPLILKEDGDLE
jgi:phosphoribosylglycinamide formyltransferase-1